MPLLHSQADLLGPSRSYVRVKRRKRKQFKLLKEPFPTILIDTREQKPYEFSGFASHREGLDTGDYSLGGYTSEVAIERKSKADAYNCVGQSRNRFEKCLYRLAQLRAPCIVIECSLKEFCNPPPRTQISSKQAVASYISWSCQYRIPVFWCENRLYAERVTLRWLYEFWKHNYHKCHGGSNDGDVNSNAAH